MNRTLLPLAFLAGLALSLSAAQPIPLARDLFNDPQWSREFTAAMTVLPDVEPAIEAADRDLFVSLNTFLQANDLVGAKNELRNQANNNPEAHPQVFFLLATLQWQDGEIEAAIRNYRRAIDEVGGFPNFRRAHKQLGQLLASEGRFSEAMPHLETAVKLGDMEPRTFGVLGYGYFQEGRYVAAEAALRQALMFDSDNESYLTLLAQSLQQQGRNAESQALYGELILKKPNEAKLWLAQSNDLLVLDEIDQAAVNIEIVRAMGEAEPEVLMLLGNIYMNKQIIGLAKEAFIDAIRADANQSPRKALAAARSLVNFASFDEATELLDVLDEVLGSNGKLDDQQEMQVLQMRAEINIAQGQGEEAARVLEEIVRRDPLNGEALITLGRYYGNNNEIERAEFMFERAQDLSDADLKAEAFIRHGQLLVRLQRWADAAQKLQMSLNFKPDQRIERYLEQVRQAAQNTAARQG